MIYKEAPGESDVRGQSSPITVITPLPGVFTGDRSSWCRRLKPSIYIKNNYLIH